MATRTSRTYKLQLSDEGLDYFIGCHARLVRVARDLIPYGVTLYAAMAIFARFDCAEQVAELEGPLCARLVGPIVHFVGFSPELRTLIVRIATGIADSNHIAGPPKVSRLYAAGLTALVSAEDHEGAEHRLEGTPVVATEVGDGLVVRPQPRSS